MTPKRITHKTPTLCWSCKNAVPGHETGCSWSRGFIPVQGWTAEETKLKNPGAKLADSFLVLECPEFMEG
jgi:hypothetical protein